MADRILLIGCGIFRGAFELLPAELRGRFEPVFLESMLHMRPGELDERLGAILRGCAGPALLLYGDCSPHMREYAAERGRARTIGANCARIFLGEERFVALRRSGAFFLLPEWTCRWERVFKVELGLSDPDLARDFMRDSADRLVYLDTGEAPVPDPVLSQASNFLGLPVEVDPTGTPFLEAALREALGRLDADGR